jgi:hypothetical protein
MCIGSTPRAWKLSAEPWTGLDISVDRSIVQQRLTQTEEQIASAECLSRARWAGAQRPACSPAMRRAESRRTLPSYRSADEHERNLRRCAALFGLVDGKCRPHPSPNVSRPRSPAPRRAGLLSFPLSPKEKPRPTSTRAFSFSGRRSPCIELRNHLRSNLLMKSVALLPRSPDFVLTLTPLAPLPAKVSTLQLGDPLWPGGARASGKVLKGGLAGSR